MTGAGQQGGDKLVIDGFRYAVWSQIFVCLFEFSRWELLDRFEQSSKIF